MNVFKTFRSRFLKTLGFLDKRWYSYFEYWTSVWRDRPFFYQNLCWKFSISYYNGRNVRLSICNSIMPKPLDPQQWMIHQWIPYASEMVFIVFKFKSVCPSIRQWPFCASASCVWQRFTHVYGPHCCATIIMWVLSRLLCWVQYYRDIFVSALRLPTKPLNLQFWSLGNYVSQTLWEYC